MSQLASVFETFNGPQPAGWLKSQRIAAFARFEHLGFPGRDQEAWKYTDTQRLAEQAFTLASTPDLAAAEQLMAQQALPLDAWRLVFVNGVFAPSLSYLQDLPAGVVLQPLSQALEQNLEHTSGLLGRLAGIDNGVFTALNQAFAHEGVVLRLPNRQVLEKPVYLLFLSVAAASPLMMHPRILIEAGVSSQAQVVEHYLGDETSQTLTTRVTEVILEAQSQLNHLLVQDPGKQATLIGRTQVEQKRDSHFACQQINFGGQLVRDDLVSDLNATGAHCQLDGLLLGQGRQHLDVHSEVRHQAPHTTSAENYRTILNDRARGVFNGKVIVKKDSQKISAEQHNANLLLSDRAEIDTKPELEIYADDVKCSHGTTTGQLDKDALFYLQSRGLSETHARGLLTLAFANEVIESIQLEAVRQVVQARVAGYLPYPVDLGDDT